MTPLPAATCILRPVLVVDEMLLLNRHALQAHAQTWSMNAHVACPRSPRFSTQQQEPLLRRDLYL